MPRDATADRHATADRDAAIDELAAARRHGRRPPTALRCRRDFDPNELGIGLEPVDWYDLAFLPTDADAWPSRLLAYAAGDFFLQDAGSLLALAAGDADRDDAWWRSAGRPPLVCDLCAAPGGKATALVESLGDQGFLIANEPIRSRLPALRHNLARTGSDRYAVTCEDPEALAAKLPGRFDLVLVDAPCSGQALLVRGRHTEAAYSPSHVAHAAGRQRRILDAAVRLLRPGGGLIYSTCTFAPEENEDQVRRLIASAGLLPRPVDRLAAYRSPPTFPPPPPASPPTAAPDLTHPVPTVSPNAPTPEGCYRLWPQHHPTAGSFAAALRKPETDAASPPWPDTMPGVTPDVTPDVTAGVTTDADIGQPPSGRGRRRPQPDRRRGRQPAEEVRLHDWLTEPNGVRLDRRDAVLIGWPADAPPWVESIAVAGPELAHRTGRTWKPAHAAAIRRVDRAGPQRRVEVDEATAREFLSGQPIRSDLRGWFVIHWQGRPLGWAKGDGRRAKNHLPPASRWADR